MFSREQGILAKSLIRRKQVRVNRRIAQQRAFGLVVRRIFPIVANLFVWLVPQFPCPLYKTLIALSRIPTGQTSAFGEDTLNEISWSSLPSSCSYHHHSRHHVRFGYRATPTFRCSIHNKTRTNPLHRSFWWIRFLRSSAFAPCDLDSVSRHESAHKCLECFVH